MANMNKSLFVLFFLMSFSAWAEPITLDEITAQNYSHIYSKSQSEYKDLLKNTSSRTLRKFRRFRKNPRLKITKDEVPIKHKYEDLKETLQVLEPIQNVKIALVDLYQDHSKNRSYDYDALIKESTRLAVGLVQETARLKKKYKLVGIPIFHNMLVNMGAKERGQCKHWAEDLLKFLKKQPRKFFLIAWGEANPQKFNEHNVAVLYPEHKSFEEGLMIDPWRSAGDPLPLRLKKDKHYKWQQWDQWGVW